MNQSESSTPRPPNDGSDQMIDQLPSLRTRRRLQKLSDRLIRVRWWGVLLAVVLFAFAFPAARRVQIDRSISAMFAPDDPTYLDYQELQTAFGGNAVAIMVYRDSDLMSTEGFARSQAISEQVAAIDAVEGVLSPAILSDLVAKLRPAGILTGFKVDTPALMRRRDIVARGIDHLFSGYTHSSDHSRAAVVAMLNPNHPPETIEEIRKVGAALTDQHNAISEVALVGEPILVNDGYDLIERDGAQLATWTVVLLSVVVLIALVDLRFILLTATMIVWTITMTKAILFWTGVSLSMVSTILTAIVTVIVVAAVLHLGVRYRISRARGFNQCDSATRAMALLLLPILWTCATDAAGFAALHWSRIQPVQQFGAMIAVSAVCAFVSMLLLAPASMMLPNWGAGSRLHIAQRAIARRLRRVCLRIASWCVAQQRLWIVLTIVMIGISLVGVWNTETETSFLKNFRSDSKIVVDYNKVESSFGGAGVWDIVVDAPDKLSKSYLAKVIALEKELRDLDVERCQINESDQLGRRCADCRQGTSAKISLSLGSFNWHEGCDARIR